MGRRAGEGFPVCSWQGFAALEDEGFRVSVRMVLLQSGLAFW